jgi:hypothetical protein
MALTTEQKQKAAADKAYYLKMADYYKKQSEQYVQKAIDSEPLELVSHASPGSFGGL